MFLVVVRHFEMNGTDVSIIVVGTLFCFVVEVVEPPRGLRMMPMMEVRRPAM
jgi:hypothetical protein